MTARTEPTDGAPHAEPARSPAPEPGEAADVNEVHLVGRVSADPEERQLPSGDRVVVWRVVVGRPPPRRRTPAGVRTATVDVVECVAWAAGVRRTAGRLRAGDVVSVAGALRRRFFRTGGAAGSRTEVEVQAVRRLARG